MLREDSVGGEGMPEGRGLGYKLTRLCLLGTLVMGIVLALIQIGMDGVRESRRIDQRALAILALVQQSAAEAAYNIDDDLAQQVVQGLTRSDSVERARILLPNRILAETLAPIPEQSLRPLTDALFQPRREYALPLQDPEQRQIIGSLELSLDTSQAGADFLSRSGLVIVSGLVRAIVLATLLLSLIHWTLTRPLLKLTEQLAGVDTTAPERTHIPLPPGHESDELGRSVQAINGLLQSVRHSLDARAAAEDQALFLRQFDGLTQLPNRALFQDRMRQGLEHARRKRETLALLLLDISDFHQLNDAYGFEFGDQVLMEVAARIRRSLRAEDQAARLSGDRFALLFEFDQHIEEALDIAETLRHSLQEPLPLPGAPPPLDVRLGLALFPTDATTAEQLLNHAETALSVAKRPGHGGIQFYETRTGEEIRTRHRLRHAIEAAIHDNAFELYYQPQFNALDGRMTGAEALLRWPQALRERVSTEESIRIAEDSGQIAALGEWIIQRACSDLAGWRAAGLQDFGLAINVSVMQLDDHRFVGLLDEALARTGLEPKLLELELTETAVMRDVDRVIRRLHAVRDRGVRIAVDDFGTGHSSLQYLKNLPITTLKIDKSFVRDLCADAGDAQIVAAIISLGHSLNKRIVAEGIADEDQLRALLRMRCDALQGFLLAAPMSAEDFAAFAASEAAEKSSEIGALIRAQSLS